MKISNNSELHLSFTRYGGFRSELTHLYHVSGKYMDQEFKKDLYQFISGMNRFNASNKSQSGISLDEVKKAMSYDVLKTLFDVLHQR